MFVLFCTQFTYDLILRPRDILRLGIYPYRFYYTYRDTISMDASFSSILTSKVKKPSLYFFFFLKHYFSAILALYEFKKQVGKYDYYMLNNKRNYENFLFKQSGA